MKHAILSGIDRIDDFAALLRGRRIALMTNPTGIDHALRSTIDILHARYGLSVLLACEHGIRGTEQAGASVGDSVDEATGVPVVGTYASHGSLRPDVLDAFDVLVFDMQDVGARFYTYLYSLSHAMESCAAAGTSVVVLDRVNPLGGSRTDGTLLDESLASFVGEYALPTRTGFTMGEYALWVRDHLGLDLDLQIVPLLGWSRDMLLPELDLPWVAPSPNCPTFETALCYLGTCVFEGSNVSEGRGTTQPFQLVGAPWIDAAALARRMNEHRLPGVAFREAAFTPVFSKWAGERCLGVQMHILDPQTAEPVLAGLLLMDEIRSLHPDRFEFLAPVDSAGHCHIDRLLGTERYRLESVSAPDLLASYAPALDVFREERRPYLLYG